MLRGWITARPITKYASTVALAIAFALGLGHATASAQPSVSRLRTGGASGAEDYLFTAGDTVYARGAADAGKYYRFVVTDPGGATRATSACRPSPKGNGGVSNSYVVAASDPVSTATTWRYQLQQFDAAGCAGSPSKTAQLYFGVAKASAYAGSSLTLPKSSFATGATAYVTIAGLTGVKTSPAAGPTADWSATWLLPSGGTACANTSGTDRPDATSGGLLPVGGAGADAFLQYRPNASAATDSTPWNLEANFETRPCADFAAANQGAWKLKLKLNNTHFVTLPAFSVDTTPPDTAITGGPAGTTRATSAVFDLSSPEAGASFECRLDGGAWAACTSPASYSGLGQGSHTLAVRAIDAAGNADPTPATQTWTVDSSVPGVTLSAPADGAATNDSTPTFSGAAGTAAGDSSAVTILIFGGASTAGTPLATIDAAASGGVWSAQAPAALDDGVYTAYATQGDSVGNTGFSAAHTFTVDTVPPRVSVIDPAAGAATSDTTPTIAGGAGGANGDAATVTVDLFGGTDTAAAPLQTFVVARSGAAWSAVPADLTEGTYTVRASQSDAAGNTSSASHTFSVDATPPSTTIVAAPGATTASTSASFRFSSSEAGSSFQCSLDGSAWGACSSPKSYSGLAAGGHAFQVRAVDAAGNVDPDGATASWTINLSLPIVTLTAPADGSATSDTTPLLAGKAGTAPGDADTVSVDVYAGTSVSGTPVQTLDTVRATGDGSWSAAVSSALPEGTYVAVARQAGAAGTGYSAARTFTVDTTAPSTQLAEGPPSATSATDASFRFASSEAGASFECRLDGGAWQPCSSPQSYSGLAAGSHTFEVRAVDAAGNADPAPVTVTWTVNPSLPAVTLADPADGAVSGDTTPLFDGGASTGAGDADSVTVKIYKPVAGGPDQLVQTRFATRSSADGSWSVHAYPALAEGTYVAHAEQSGTAGTGASASHTFTVDTTPPRTTLTLAPQGVTPSTDARLRFDSSEPGSTFECRLDGGDWQSCTSPAAYTGLSADSHTFEVRAIDAAGNVDPSPASASWVVDPTAPAVTLTSPADDSWTSDVTPRLSGTASTAAGDSSTVTVELYAGTSTSGTPLQTLTTTRSATDGSWSVVPSPALPEGTYVAFAEQSDAAGNTATSAARTFTIDTTAAAPTLDQPADGAATNDATPRLAGAAGTADGDAGTVTVRIYPGTSVGGTALQTLTPARSAGRWTVDAGALPDGTYTVSVEQDDAAGNAGFSDARTLTIDTQAPHPTLDAPADGAVTNDATPHLAGAAGAAAGDADAVTVKVYAGSSPTGTPAQTLTAHRSSGSWSLDAAPLADGTYTVTAAQADAAGNAASAPARTFTVDTSAPNTELAGGPTGSVTATGATFELRSSEAGARFECRLDGAAWNACSSPATLSGLSARQHRFDVRAIDRAGNVDATPASRTWTVLAPSTPTPPASGSQPPASTPPAVAPLKLSLAAPPRNKLRRKRTLLVRATCSARCAVTLTVKVRIRTGARKALVLKLRPAKATLSAGKRTAVALKLSAKNRRAILRALGLRRRVTVAATGRARTPTAVTATSRLSFRLRR